MIDLRKGNCFEIIDNILEQYKHRKVVFVSDPPFNIGYHYNTYKDRQNEAVYFNNLKTLFSKAPSVIIHYPEQLYRLSIELNKAPNKVVSWVYNSNLCRQHRDIAFFDITPDFKKVLQPYKNLNDKRIQERIKRGLLGCKLYDWWNINQVKNVSKDKTSHPCQMPIKVMENIISILPSDILVIDPFMGGGTTGVACLNKRIDFVGIELDEEYFKICEKRINKEI